MSILKNCTLIVPTFQQSKPDCDVWILFISTKFPQTYLPASIYYNVDHVLTQFMKHEHKHYLRWWYTFLHDIMVYIIYYSLVVIKAQHVHVIWPSASCYVELQPYWQHKQYTAAAASVQQKLLVYTYAKTKLTILAAQDHSKLTTNFTKK